MRMIWHELCFLHWRVPAGALRQLVPAGLELDTYDGDAWIGVVPFHMTRLAPRGVPRIPPLTDFAELNVRTYVTTQGKPGVWFFSLDATQPLAVRVARGCFHLPYLDARIDVRREGEDVAYRSVRTHLGAGSAELAVRYRPTGPVAPGEPGTLEHFLTERYCLYTADGGRLYRAELHHAPWLLRPAEASIESATISPVVLEGEPHLLYAATQDVLVWPLEEL
jgi:uncharacterized protein YqjF (DUF2071 family)